MTLPCSIVCCASTVTLQDVSISPMRVNTTFDVLFGNIGQDFIRGFESVTLDFDAMTFSVGASR